MYGVGDGAFYLPLMSSPHPTELSRYTKGPNVGADLSPVCKVEWHSGTFGPGYNSMSNIHVKDVASAIITILTAALQGRTDEGHEGLCKSSMPPILSH